MKLRTSRVGKNSRVQMVTIPRELQSPEGMQAVFIRKVSEDLVLSPRPADWSGFLASMLRASDDFMNKVENLPIQERRRL